MREACDTPIPTKNVNQQQQPIPVDSPRYRHQRHRPTIRASTPIGRWLLQVFAGRGCNCPSFTTFSAATWPWSARDRRSLVRLNSTSAGSGAASACRPRITCLWALNGRRDRLDFDTWMRLDMRYIDNWSLGLDCKILLRTIPQVLLGRDAN